MVRSAVFRGYTAQPARNAAPKWQKREATSRIAPPALAIGTGFRCYRPRDVVEKSYRRQNNQLFPPSDDHLVSPFAHEPTGPGDRPAIAV